MTDGLIATPRRRRAGRVRKWIALGHSWSGALTFLLVFLVSVSGGLAALSPQFFEWQFKALDPIAPYEDAMPLDQATILERLAENAPEGFTTLSYYAPGSRFTIDAGWVFGAVRTSEGEQAFEGRAVDPYTGALSEPLPFARSITYILVHFHDSLLLGENGKTIVTIIGILTVVFILTGLYQWWPRRGSAARKAVAVSLKGSRTSKLFRLHGLLGVWFTPLALLFVVTGVLYARPDWFGDPFPRSTGQPVGAEEGSFSRDCGDGPVSAAEALRTAQARFPDGALRFMDFPAEKPVYHIRFFRPGDGDHTRGDAQAWVGAACNEVLHAQAVDRADPAAYGGALMYSLHSGRWFGPVLGPVLVMTTGLGLGALSFIGLWLWWRKTVKKPRYEETSIMTTDASGRHVGSPSAAE